MSGSNSEQNITAIQDRPDHDLINEIEGHIVPIMDGYYGPALDHVVLDIIAAVRRHDAENGSYSTEKKN